MPRVRTVPLDITAPAAEPPRASRTAPDRCPTAIALHPAADGLIARVRLPGGRLTVAQARRLAAWAEPQVEVEGAAARVSTSAVSPAAADRIELTVRGNFQIRGLAAADAGPLAAALHGAGLLPSEPHDQARTIVASPLAGRLRGTQHGIDDVVRAIDTALCAEPDLTKLSGRFLIAVDDGIGSVDTARADLALAFAPPAATVSAAVGGDRATVLVGGVAAGDVRRDAAPAAVVHAAGAFVRAAAEAAVAGDGAWRVSELADGGAGIRAALLADGVVVAAAAGRRSFARVALPPLGIGQQVDGRAFVRASSVLGRLTAAQLRTAADAAEVGGSDLRIAVDRSLTIPDLAPKHAAAALAALAAAGLAVDDADPALGLTACAGLGCATSRGDVRAAAALRLRTRRPGAAREHLVGCERRCGAPASGATTLVLAQHESPDAFAERAARTAGQETL
jgi:precorrin-3B synthase